MGNKIRVGAVSYLNTKPLIYGFEQGMMAGEIELTIDFPARVAEMLKNGAVDIGLVPVAILPRLQQYQIVSNYCIGCNGPVASVALFSQVPVAAIKTVLLDYQSRTSAALLKILLREYWNITPALVPAYPGYEKDIAGTTAGLVIGDRAFEQRHRSAYIYDLGEAWKTMTGLPFVFAVWASLMPVPEVFIKSFASAQQLGLLQTPVIAAAQAYDGYNLEKYYSENICYDLNAAAREGLSLFLSRISAV